MGVTILRCIPSRCFNERFRSLWKGTWSDIGDLQIWDPEFKVPDDIQDRLLKKHLKTPLIGVIVIKHSNGEIEYFTDPNLKEFSLDGEIQLATNEQLILKTRVRNGEMSFEDAAVKFKYGNKCIPQHIIDSFRAQDKKA